MNKVCFSYRLFLLTEGAGVSILKTNYRKQNKKFISYFWWSRSHELKPLKKMNEEVKMLRISKVFLICFTVLLISTLFIVPGAVFADEITDSIEEAMAYYKENNYVEASNSLDYASQLIRQKRSGKLEAFLPEPLAGWSAEDVKSQAAGPGYLGGMISAKRKYKKDKSSVTMEIITDSPTLQSMVMLFSNPAYASADGGTLTKIKRQKAIVKYNPSKKNGEINIVVAKQYLVSVKGRNVNKNDLVDYASAIDYKNLKKF